LKELYEESYEKLKIVENKNKELKYEIDTKTNIIKEKNTKIGSLEEEIRLLKMNLNIKEESINTILREK
jgi:hypothetical protein